MTPSIAQFMRDLEQVWDAHQQALLQRRGLAAALASLAAEPAVTHIPALTGATGRQAVERFYADQLLPHLPDDLELRRISRTVDRWRLVDETTVSFTHDRELPWLLPGTEPTFRRAEVLAIAVVGFDAPGSGPSACSGITPPWPRSWGSEQLLPQQPPARRDELAGGGRPP